MTVEKRKAFVTGSGRNIGSAIALRLAHSGHDLAIHARANAARAEGVARAARAFGVDAIVCVGELGSRDDITRIAEHALGRFGHVDILVNVAAVRPFKPFLAMSYDEWQKVMEVNVNGVFLMIQAFLPGMVERSWGRIINFAGMNSIRGYPDRVHIATSKHAVWGMTKALSREFGPYNITANCISPGPTATEQVPDFAALIQAQVKEIPLGRLGRAEEIAALVEFLASDGGGFISGQLIGANGGAET
jgi:3-oxoacyl-[acyl-carrier protein] reductase